MNIAPVVSYGERFLPDFKLAWLILHQEEQISGNKAWKFLFQIGLIDSFFLNKVLVYFLEGNVINKH